jgi:hypothetical protein
MKIDSNVQNKKSIMKKPNKPEKFAFLPVPQEIKDAVRLIENWTKMQTMRDDWAIGGICCRAGAERQIRALAEIEKIARKSRKTSNLDF